VAHGVGPDVKPKYDQKNRWRDLGTTSLGTKSLCGS
jgi:hypothetical protein